MFFRICDKALIEERYYGGLRHYNNYKFTTLLSFQKREVADLGGHWSGPLLYN